MDMRILGPLEVAEEGAATDRPSGRARLVPGLVVHVNQVLSTDRLFEILSGGAGRPTRRRTGSRRTSRTGGIPSIRVAPAASPGGPVTQGPG